LPRKHKVPPMTWTILVFMLLIALAVTPVRYKGEVNLIFLSLRLFFTLVVAVVGIRAYWRYWHHGESGPASDKTRQSHAREAGRISRGRRRAGDDHSSGARCRRASIDAFGLARAGRLSGPHSICAGMRRPGPGKERQERPADRAHGRGAKVLGSIARAAREGEMSTAACLDRCRWRP
jgi:hypothetical protein